MQVVLGNKVDVDDSKRMVSSCYRFAQRDKELEEGIFLTTSGINKTSHDLLPITRRDTLL